MKERSRKQNFLKQFGLVPVKNSRSIEQEDEVVINERLCFYSFEENGHVVCRSCYKSFSTWLNYRMHFNVSCSIAASDYKWNTYNEVYKKYKLKKAKTNKKIKDSTTQFMDPETLNTRKTRKRCYTNAARAAANGSKSSPESSSSSGSEKTISVKRVAKREAFEIGMTSDESVEEAKPETFECKKTVQNIPVGLNADVPNPKTTTIKMEWKASDVSRVSSDDRSSNYRPNYKPIEDKPPVYRQYVCVVCDERFMSKCLLTMHQVQHIKSDRSCYNVVMAALTRSS